MFLSSLSKLGAALLVAVTVVFVPGCGSEPEHRASQTVHRCDGKGEDGGHGKGQDEQHGKGQDGQPGERQDVGLRGISFSDGSTQGRRGARVGPLAHEGGEFASW